MSDEAYIDMVHQSLKEAGYPEGFYSDKTLLHLKTTMQKAHENPRTSVRVVDGIDDICRGCDYVETCQILDHPYYAAAYQADRKVKDTVPDLKIGETQQVRQLMKLFGVNP